MRNFYVELLCDTFNCFAVIYFSFSLGQDWLRIGSRNMAIIAYTNVYCTY